MVKESKLKTADNKLAAILKPLTETDVDSLNEDHIRLFISLHEKSNNKFNPLKKFRP